MSKEITKFVAKPYLQGSGSYVIVIPKSKFIEGIMEFDKEYEFIVLDTFKKKGLGGGSS